MRFSAKCPFFTPIFRKKAVSLQSILKIENYGTEILSIMRMPLTEEILGTNADGCKNEDYCIYCMKDGAFTGNFTMEDQETMKQLLTCNTIGLFTTDNTRMVDFYTEIMGFETNWNGFYFEKMISQGLTYPPGLNGTMEISFDVPTFADVDKEYARVVSMGATPVMKPTTEPWGQRTCYIADPDGNLIEISSFKEK